MPTDHISETGATVPPNMDSMPPSPVRAEGARGFRRMAAVISMVALGSGGLGFAISEATSPDHRPAPIAAEPHPHKSEQPDTEVSPEQYQIFDFDAAYEQSKAVLERTGLKLAVPVSHEEEMQLGDIRQKLSDAEQAGIIPGGKGGGDAKPFTKNDYYKQFNGVLTKAESDLYFEKYNLAFDRSMRERDDVEVAIQNNSAKYYGSVVTTPGVRFNIFEAHPNQALAPGQKADELMVDPKALDTLVQFLIHEMSSLGTGNHLLLSQAEVERIQSAAKEEDLTNVTMTLILADKLEDCVISPEKSTLTSVVRQPIPPEVCFGLGVESDHSDMQYAHSSDFRNILLFIGRTSNPFTPAPQDGHNLPLSVNNGNQTLMTTVTHEIAHGLMGPTTLTYNQRFGTTATELGNDPEHAYVVKELEQRVANFFVFGTPEVQKLTAFAYKTVSVEPRNIE